MTFDFTVYVRHVPSQDEYRRLLASSGGDISAPSVDFAAVSVVQRDELLFTVDGPLDVFSEDLPDGIEFSSEASAYAYQISSTQTTAIALVAVTEFARHLAGAGDGLLMDHQLGTIWRVESGTRVARAPEASRIDIAQFRWYFHSSISFEEIGETWVRLARQMLPEAIPARFGAFEPHGGSLRTDAGKFLSALDAGGTVNFSAKYLVLGGGANAPRPGVRSGLVRSFSLDIDPRFLTDGSNDLKVKNLFQSFASSSKCFFATGELVRDYLWSGTQLSADRSTEQPAYLAPRGIWMGLPPYPVWHFWCDPEYSRRLSASWPSQARVVDFSDGTFVSLSDALEDRDKLADSLGSPWIDEEFTARKIATAPGNILSWGLTPADLIPQSLER